VQVPGGHTHREAIRMAGVRKISPITMSTFLPCSRCQATGCHWDKIAGTPICPDCQESLAQGCGEPLIAKTEKKPCNICGRIGILRVHTFPLVPRTRIEMELCAEHFRSLISRRLNPRAYQSLRGQLTALGVEVEQVFLLHGAFYDNYGRALQPAREVEY
jgi:hypothetical protein